MKLKFALIPLVVAGMPAAAHEVALPHTHAADGLPLVLGLVLITVAAGAALIRSRAGTGARARATRR